MEQYKKLQEELFESVYGENHRAYKDQGLSNFVAMKGSEYTPDMEGVRFMLVGRATNGWGNDIPTTSAEEFADKVTTVFEKNDRYKTEWQMKDTAVNPYSEYKDKNGEWKKYYLSGSPFWNYAGDIWCKLNDIGNKPDWYEKIVWNNIYKVAPSESGNPSTNLIYAQAKVCVKLLKEEIRILKPTHVLLVIDKGWISWTSRKKVMFNFMEAFDDYYEIKESIPENQEIVQRAFFNGETKVLVTCRPEQKGKDDYVNTVVEAFNNIKKLI